MDFRGPDDQHAEHELDESGNLINSGAVRNDLDPDARNVLILLANKLADPYNSPPPCSKSQGICGGNPEEAKWVKFCLIERYAGGGPLSDEQLTSILNDLIDQSYVEKRKYFNPSDLGQRAQMMTGVWRPRAPSEQEYSCTEKGLEAALGGQGA